MIPPRGFESYNIFKNNIKDIKQLYDLTFHLYHIERNRLEKELPKKNNKNVITVKTSVGEIEHSLTSLYQRLKSSYPYKLRQLLLVNSITALEVYLTDAVKEIFNRDIKPFKEDKPITLQKNYLLNLNSITEIQENLIKKDIRNLTSGGLVVIKKYYKKIFEIEFQNLGITFDDIVEIHIRRHLIVHRNGIADSEYYRKYPQFQISEGQKIRIEHDYFIKSLDSLSGFAGLINKALLNKFPQETRKTTYSYGNANFENNEYHIMVEIGIFNADYDYELFLKKLKVRNKKLDDFIVQITKQEKNLYIFLSGEPTIINSFFKPIKDNDNLNFIRIIKIKSNAS